MLQRVVENMGTLKFQLTKEEEQQIRLATEKAGISEIPRQAALHSAMAYIDTPELPQ